VLWKKESQKYKNVENSMKYQKFSKVSLVYKNNTHLVPNKSETHLLIHHPHLMHFMILKFHRTLQLSNPALL